MNNPYLIERLVKLKMQEIQREVEQARLLKEAGLSGESWLVHAVNALRNLLIARKKSFQDQHTNASQTCQCTSGKLS